ncbi:hypothetical protein ACIO13_31350 [Streptomyces sp. NPDC087425]
MSQPPEAAACVRSFLRSREACRDLVRQNILHEPHSEWFRIIKQ